MNKHYLTYIIGDWSNDGHGRTETFVLLSSVGQEEFLCLKNKGAEEFGLNLKELWYEFEDCTVKPEMETILKKLEVSYIEYEGPFLPRATPRTMMELIVALVKVADPSVEVEILNEDKQAMKFYEGYGLFD